MRTLVMMLLQAATEEISCKWLLTAMGGALAGTNVFWAVWVKTLISENKTLNSERVQDLKDTIKSAKD
jgi:hypothetical protein